MIACEAEIKAAANRAKARSICESDGVAETHKQNIT
jgi:hypothetical protein